MKIPPTGPVAPFPVSGQSRIASGIETLTNIAIGFGVALASQYLIFPWFGIQLPLSSHLWITVWFTVISIVRSYLLRRYFNARLARALKEHFA